jgi:hypothetical protein
MMDDVVETVTHVKAGEVVEAILTK